MRHFYFTDNELRFIVVILFIAAFVLIKKFLSFKQIIIAQTSTLSKKNEQIASFQKEQADLQAKNIQQEQDIRQLEDHINQGQTELQFFLSSKKEIMPYLAGMIADYLTLEYDRSANYLTHKSRPALKEALRIQDLKKETKNLLSEYKIYEYQLKYLLQLYPTLEDQLDAEFYTSEPINYKNHDPVRDWLSPDEWKQLPETQKNQLALDRYINHSSKSKWQIGRDYELFIGQHYENLGYCVEYYGMEKSIADLGRDLIAKKGTQTLIIQCKCWSKHKNIHENSITQLFGTVTAYRIEHENLFEMVDGVLVTTISLTETAKKFATLLNITVIENMPMQDFPRIKCNINQSNEKIYHLPIDQQYDHVKINKSGECYAYTVDEAEQKGFRHAFKYTGNFN